MNFLNDKYIDFKILNVTKLRDKYGFRIILYYFDNSIKTIQKGGFISRSEASKARDIVVYELYSNTFVVENKITVKEFFTKWLELDIKKRVTYNTYISYRNVVNNYIIKVLGKKKLSELKRINVMKLIIDISKNYYSISEIIKTVFSTALNVAFQNGLIERNFMQEINLPRKVIINDELSKINNTKTLTMDQTVSLLKEARKTPIFICVLFACLMGLRKSEIKGLKYSDINFANKTVKVQRQLGRNINNKQVKLGEVTKQELKLKTKSSYREIVIPDIVLKEILKEQIKYEKNRSRRINDKTNPFLDLNYIYCSTYGKPRSPSFEQKYFKDILKNAKLPNIRFHDLRATYATMLVSNNFNPKAIAEILGHSREIITIDRYTNKKTVIENFNETLNPIINKLIKNDESKNKDNYNKEYLALIDKINNVV